MSDPSPDLPVQVSLLRDTQALAKELNISWSRLVTLALKDFIRRYRGRKQLVDRINAAYVDTFNNDELRLARARRATHRKLVEGEW